MPRTHRAKGPARIRRSPVPRKEQGGSICISEDQRIKVTLTRVFSALRRNVPPLGNGISKKYGQRQNLLGTGNPNLGYKCSFLVLGSSCVGILWILPSWILQTRTKMDKKRLPERLSLANLTTPNSR